MSLKTPVDPVKCTPAKSGLANKVSVIESPMTMLITPLGNPASLNICINKLAEYTCVAAGFKTTTFPIKAALVGKFPAIAKVERSNSVYKSFKRSIFYTVPHV
jgi:hypothetical protein